jgi:hypothetical protein
MTPLAALRRAQAEMRRWNRNPYYWGAFVLYGDRSRPVLPAESSLPVGAEDQV